MTQPSEIRSKIQPPMAENLSVKAKFLEELIPIAENLSKLPDTLISLLPYRTEAAEKISQHVFAAGGKRVRPALFMLCCRLTGYKGEHLLPVASVAEYVHTASLLHDDVVDQSDLRRGSPTANAKWGNQASVLVGDLIYATACEIMAKTGKVELVRTFAEAIRRMSDGELLQMENSFNSNATVDDYIEILEGKTGVLIGASCAAAGILSEVSIEKTQALFNFGNKLGIAFQLIDDALDYSTKNAEVGKPTLADIVEGKLTYPVLQLRHHATDQELSDLLKIIKTKAISKESADWISILVRKYHTDELTIQKAANYTESALNDLKSNFPATQERHRIERIAKLLLERNS